MQRAHKERVTITLAADLLDAVDREAHHLKTSRSAVIAARLQSDERRRQREEVDRQIVDYYRSMRVEERVEDDDWVRAAATASREAITREERPSRRRKRS